MKSNRRWISYDWFKLITALILLIIFIVLMLQPAPLAVAELPDYPAASFDWKLGPDGKTLIDPQGNALFALSADGLGWEPTIPDDLRATLPTGFKLVPGEDGGWTIQDTDGNLLHTWDMGAFTWTPVAAAVEPEVELPDFPAASFEWKLGPDGRTLLDPQGSALFALSAESLSWEPVIPDDLKATLPAGFKLVPGADGGWEIQDADGNLLYTWDLAAFTWVPAAVATAATATAPTATPTSQAGTAETQAPAQTPTAAPTEAPTAVPTTAPTAEPTAASTAAPTAASPTGCQAPAPARLVVGQSASIRSNLNMRSEPLIGNNILQTNPTGMVLQVLDGPVCVPHQGSAYLWWQVETPDGKTGWSAEATLNGSFYFLEPAP